MSTFDAENWGALTALIKRETGAETALSHATNIQRDLNLDSLQALQLVGVIEEKFNVIIPLETLPTIQTLGDLNTLLVKLRSA